MGIYAQDQWRVGERLTLNLGVRFLNGNAVTGVNNAYLPVGITWRRPSAVLGPRLFKIGMQFEF